MNAGIMLVLYIVIQKGVPMKSELNENELFILQYLWENGPKTFADIMQEINYVLKKDWKKQTINTYLLRLKKKGYLGATKKDNRATYFPTITSDEYYEKYAKNIINTTFNGSLKQFISCFSGGKHINDAEKKELIEYIKDL